MLRLKFDDGLHDVPLCGQHARKELADRFQRLEASDHWTTATTHHHWGWHGRSSSSSSTFGRPNSDDGVARGKLAHRVELVAAGVQQGRCAEHGMRVRGRQRWHRSSSGCSGSDLRVAWRGVVASSTRSPSAARTAAREGSPITIGARGRQARNDHGTAAATAIHVDSHTSYIGTVASQCAHTCPRQRALCTQALRRHGLLMLLLLLQRRRHAAVQRCGGGLHAAILAILLLLRLLLLLLLVEAAASLLHVVVHIARPRRPFDLLLLLQGIAVRTSVLLLCEQRGREQMVL